MPYCAHYTPNGAHVSFTGLTTGAEIVEAKAAALAYPYADRFQYVLCDFSDADRLDVPTSAVRCAAQADRDFARAHAPFAVAVVAPQTLTFGLSRMWQAFVDDTGIRSTVVRTREEAVGWLAELGLLYEPV
jgi:hypothetical protein